MWYDRINKDVNLFLENPGRSAFVIDGITEGLNIQQYCSSYHQIVKEQKPRSHFEKRGLYDQSIADSSPMKYAEHSIG